MPNNEIEIRDPRGYLTGRITFQENPARLHAYRTAGGFKLSLPLKLYLRVGRKGDPLPMLSNFSGEIIGGGDSGPAIEVGRAYWDDWYNSGWSHDGSGGMAETDVTMTWYGSLTELAHYERLRDGGSPKFSVRFRGELCYLVEEPNTGHLVRTQPQSVYSNFGSVTVTYPKEVWVGMLRSIGAAENVLVEIPLPGSPSPDWDEVWRGLVDARNAFEQGGSTGWKGCVTGVRLALEKWQQLEPEDKGPGWVSPSVPDRRARTKEQWLDNIRWHLLQVAHIGAHTHADIWTRDDALLMLSTLSVLLAERKS